MEQSFISDYTFEGRTIEVHKAHYLVVKPEELFQEGPKLTLDKLQQLVPFAYLRLEYIKPPKIEQPTKVVQEYVPPQSKKGWFS